MAHALPSQEEFSRAPAQIFMLLDSQRSGQCSGIQVLRTRTSFFDDIALIRLLLPLPRQPLPQHSGRPTQPSVESVSNRVSNFSKRQSQWPLVVTIHAKRQRSVWAAGPCSEACAFSRACYCTSARATMLTRPFCLWLVCCFPLCRAPRMFLDPFLCAPNVWASERGTGSDAWSTLFAADMAVCLYPALDPSSICARSLHSEDDPTGEKKEIWLRPCEPSIQLRLSFFHLSLSLSSSPTLEDLPDHIRGCHREHSRSERLANPAVTFHQMTVA